MTYFTKMRKINNGDVFKLAGIIAKNAKALRPYLSQLQAEDADTAEIGMELIMDIAPTLGKEGYKLLLNIVDMTQEEFEALPVDSMMALYEEIQEMNDLQAFFDGAAKLASTFLAKNSAPKKSPSTSMTHLQVVTDGLEDN